MPTLRRGAFYGTSRGLDVGGVRLSEVVHTASRELPSHAHAAAYFCLLLEVYDECSDGECLRYAPLTLAYHPAELVHDDRIGASGARFFIVELGAELDACAHAALPRRLSSVRGEPALWLTWRLYEEFVSEVPDAAIVESLGYELCASIATMEPMRSNPPWLAGAHAVIDARFREPISLGDVAAAVGVHPISLARAFRRACGRSVGEHLQRMRLQAACKALRSTRASIAEIASNAGFSDEAHLGRIARRYAGATPGRIRRSGARCITDANGSGPPRSAGTGTP